MRYDFVVAVVGETVAVAAGATRVVKIGRLQGDGTNPSYPTPV